MKEYHVIAGDLERDREQILEIWRRNLSDVKNLEQKYAWHFLSNPQGPGKCWMLAADARLIGTACLGMRAVHVGSRVEAAGVACDLAVDKEHRLLGPALLLHKAVTACVGSELRMVYGLPNQNGAAVVRRVGYREAGEVHRYVRVLRPSAYPERMAGLLRVKGAATALDFVFTRFDSWRDHLSRNYALELHPAIDERFDELWRSRKEELGIATVRDAKYLRWRFADCPLKSYTVIAVLADERSRLAGFLVEYMHGPHMALTDLLAGPRKEDAKVLVAAALMHARQSGAASLSIHCALPIEVLSLLKERGFSLRTESSRASHATGDAARRVLVYSGSATIPALEWYFTSGDEPYN